jgi:hypothetical protein
MSGTAVNITIFAETLQKSATNRRSGTASASEIESLTARRIALGLRLRDVAERMNRRIAVGEDPITHGAISHWERNRRSPTPEHLAAWQAALE